MQHFSRSLLGLATLTLFHAAPAVATPSEWKTLDDQRYRVEADGNFSCYSEDGIHCKPGAPSTNPERVKPLVCGNAHRSVWGTTGYDTSAHWCNEAHANLFAAWKDYDVLAHSGYLSVNANGDPMCMSDNAKDCYWGDRRTQFPMDARIRPLVCGNAHRQRWGVTGYEPENKAHWCQVQEILSQHFDPAAHPLSPLEQALGFNTMTPDVVPGTDFDATLTYTLEASDRVAEDAPKWLLRFKRDQYRDSPSSTHLQFVDRRQWKITTVISDPSKQLNRFLVRLDPFAADPEHGGFSGLVGWNDKALPNTGIIGFAASALPPDPTWPTARLVVRVEDPTGNGDRKGDHASLTEAVLARHRPAPRIAP